MRVRQFAASLLLPLGGCAVLGGHDECDAYERRLERVHAQIEAAIGPAEAEDVSACRTVGFGAKPCGGPWTYLVYSAATSDTAEVQRLVAEYNRLDDERNRACELASDCLVVGPPAVDVVGGRCVAVQP